MNGGSSGIAFLHPETDVNSREAACCCIFRNRTSERVAVCRESTRITRSVDGLELHGGQGHGHTTIARGLVGCVACGICLGIAGFIRCPRGPRLGAGQRAQAFGRPLALPWGRTLPAVSVLAVAPIVTTANLLQGSLSICLSTF
jgi:hypothetical protein